MAKEPPGSYISSTHSSEVNRLKDWDMLKEERAMPRLIEGDDTARRRLPEPSDLLFPGCTDMSLLSLKFSRDSAFAVGSSPGFIPAVSALLEQIRLFTGWKDCQAWVPHGEFLEPIPRQSAGEPAILLLPGIGLAGRAWHSSRPVVIPALHSDPGLSGVSELRNSGCVSAAAYAVRGKDGPLFVVVAGMPVWNEREHAVLEMVLATATDLVPIFAEKMTRAEHRVRMQRSNEALELANVGIIDWHIDENDVHVSAEFQRATGIRWMKGPIEALLVHVHVDDRVGLDTVLRSAAIDGQAFRRMIRFSSAAGITRWFDLSGRVTSGDENRERIIVIACLDVTSARENQEWLRDREFRLSLMLRQLPALLWTTDRELRYTSIQGTALRSFRETYGVREGRKMFPEGPPVLGAPDRPRYDAHVRALEGISVTFEQDDADRSLQCLVEPLHHPDGSIAGVIGIASDVTERTNAEREVRKSRDRLEQEVADRTAELVASRRRLQEVLDSITDQYCRLDSSFVVRDANPAASMFFGMPREHLLGRPLFDLFPDEANHDFRYAAESGLATGAPLHRELYAPLVGRWAFVHLNPGVDGIEMYFSDITERKQFVEDLTHANDDLRLEVEARKEFQRALQSSELRYRAVVEVQTEMVCRFTPDGILTFANGAFCSYFGIDRKRVLGQPYGPIVFREDLSLVRAKLVSLTPGNPSTVAENRVVDGKERVRWVQWTHQALYSPEGTLIEYQASGTDISERKRAETLKAVQYEVSVALAESKDLQEAIRQSLQAICRRTGWNEAVLWPVIAGVLRPDADFVWHGNNDGSEGGRRPTLLAERVVNERRSIWLPAGASASVQLRGFKSILGIPVRSGEHVSAVIECFSFLDAEPEREMVDTLEAIGHQIGNYRERRRAEEILRHSAEQLEVRVRQRTEQLAQALKALSDSEMRFRAMFHDAPLGIALISTTGRITERNPTLERMLGYAEGALEGKHFQDIIHPDDREIASHHFSDLLGGAGELQRTEVRFLARDATLVWGSLSTSVLSFDSPRAPFVIAMIKDVTERRTIETKLREQETRLRTIFEEAPIGISLMTADGTTVQCNRALCAMVHRTPEQIIGSGIEAMLAPPENMEDLRLHRMMVEGGIDRYRLDQQYAGEDGTASWGHLNATAVRSPEREFLYSLRLVEDITRRRETEQQVRMLAHTITSMNESVIITDARFVVLSVNTAFCSSFGYEEREVLGRHVGILRSPDVGPDVLRALGDHTLAGGWTGEMNVTRKDGTTFPIMLSTSLVRDEHGNTIALVGIARDITEQKVLQRRLEAAERRRSEDLRRFAVSVQRAQEEERQRISRELHDDICQRLSGMKLNMEVLEDDVRPKDRRIARTLRNFQKQFEQTINEVRRMSSNLRPAVLDDFGLSIALNLLVREFERQTMIPVTVDTGNPALYHLHPEVEIALYRIAQESLTNISKHANPSSVRIQLVKGPGTIDLIVADDGKGFDEQDSARARSEGHGFGLIGMRERAELLGGTLRVETSISHGTTVHVSIPLENASEP
jgi:PAS domain S-box-containing protein